ncbi:hypothetical protein V8D89_002295 [Ganoderma adspersum]
MSSAPNFAGLALDGTYGALLLGTFFSLVLYGLILHQTYRYVRLHPHDYTYIQVLVALSLILETLHTICTMHFNYHALVTNYFNPIALAKTVWSLDFFVLAGTFSQITTYSFFFRRLYFVAGSFKYIALLAVAFLGADAGFSIVMTIRVFHLDDPEQFLSVTKHQQYLVHGKFAAAIATHIPLTGSLIYALYRGQKARKEQKSIMDWCLLYVVNTGFCCMAGLLVSVFDVIAWILAYAIPGTVWWAALGPIIVKRMFSLPFSTFYFRLNSRRLLTETFIEIFGLDSPASSERNFISRAQRLATAERYNAPQLPDRTPTRIDIKVATEIEEGDGDTQSRTSHSSAITEGGKAVGI